MEAKTDGIRYKKCHLSDDYLIYEDGRVYSLLTNKFLKFCVNNRNYFTVRIYINKISKQISVHRLVAFAFLEKPLGNKTDVNHIDGNKRNNHISNLEWTNDSENSKHAYKIGLRDRKMYQGENNVTSKLTNEQVLEIRRLRKEDALLKDLSKLFGICVGHICKVAKNDSWKHLKQES